MGARETRMRLRRTWLDRWSPGVESVVRALPASDLCPHELALTLLERNLATGGRIALVETKNEPVAVIGLEREGKLRWRTQTSWLIPGFACVAADGMALTAIGSLDAEVAVGWWRMPGVPAHPKIRESHEKPSCRLGVADREAFWRGSGMWRTIVTSRNRCARLAVRVNEPGDAEWIIRSWADKWATPEDPRPKLTAEAQIEIARQLTPSGKLFTLVLHDDDGTPLVGSTNFIDGNVAVAGVLYRDEIVGNLPTGVRMIDEVFEYCERTGLREFDLGGGYSYKSKWAPTNGANFDLILAPTMRHFAHKLAQAFH